MSLNSGLPGMISAKAERFPARFYNAWQRYENPGLAKHWDYDRIVTAPLLIVHDRVIRAIYVLLGFTHLDALG